MTVYLRKVWSECKNGEEEWGETLRACEARATLADHAYGASRLKKTTVLQSRLARTSLYKTVSLNIIFCFFGLVADKKKYNQHAGLYSRIVAISFPRLSKENFDFLLFVIYYYYSRLKYFLSTVNELKL